VIARGLAALVLCTACGDDALRADDPLAAVSGSRLALHKYRYDDGTELAVANDFYDTQLHVRCRPQRWIDGALRCIPAVDDAVYVDPGCTALVGLGRTIARPTHFVAYDMGAAGVAPARLFRSGPATDPIAQYYTIADDACVGPTAAPADLARYFEIGDELDGAALVAFRDGELGEGRVALHIRQTDDGLRVPSGLVDRELGAPCVARLRSDGSFACEPLSAATAVFRDPACREPVVPVTAAVPAFARVIEPSGCASYHRVGGELPPPAGSAPAPMYRRIGGACTTVATPVEGRLHAVDPALDLAALARSLEDSPARRLQRVVLEHGELRFLDDRLFDAATGDDCRPRSLREGVRCLPAALASIGLFTAGCTVAVRVAEVPQRTCERFGFATQNRPFQLRPLGDIVDLLATPLFRLDATGCQPYTSPPGTELRDLGPPLDLADFPAGQYFSER
jgi:hypothetical protein